MAAPGAPWPLPQRWVNSTSVKTLNPDTIQFVSNADSCDVIVDAFARYKAILRLDASATADAGLPGISVVNVVIQDTACGNPDEFMNENRTFLLISLCFEVYCVCKLFKILTDFSLHY